MRSEQVAYAQQFPPSPYPESSGKYHGFYRLAELARMFVPGEPIFRVNIIADEVGDYATWWDAKRDEFCFTSYHRDLVEICFAYGSKIEEEHGNGKVIRCRVELLSMSEGV